MAVVDDLALEVSAATYGKDTGIEYVEGLYSHLYYIVLCDQLGAGS